MSACEDERVTDEVEALEAILLDDVVIKRVDGVAHIVETILHPSTGDDADQQFVCVTLEVTLTAGYPDTSPDVVLRNPRGLDDELLVGIKTQIKEKLAECLGQPVVFELIELIRENLTESNLPSGQCAICLYGFSSGDAFIKTQCYHHFHSHCLAGHLVAGEQNYQEELGKLPQWQRQQAPPYQPVCPVCRSAVACDLEALRLAPPPRESESDPPFCLTAELKALQLQMASLFAQQVAKGGTVLDGDTGPPPLTIATPADNPDAETNNPSASLESDANKSEMSQSNGGRHNGQSSAGHSSPGSPRHQPGPARGAYKGPFRGFNRRGSTGRRPNQAGRGRAGGSQPCASGAR